MGENVALIKEINELRREVKVGGCGREGGKEGGGADIIKQVNALRRQANELRWGV
jgi:hypothetical protein